ncbi:MAG: hypothetical protein KGN79_11260 [Acidobacteriota bacterium]|nr:hypothetical protein [Acidobacteriota bacterium]
MPTALSEEVQLRVKILFKAEERAFASELLASDCGNNLPFCANSTPSELDRIRCAALKLSEGEIAKLKKAVVLAKLDWRDLLVAAGFADDVYAHEQWFPD